VGAELRSIEAEELGAFTTAANAAFFHVPSDDYIERQRAMTELDRTLAYVEDGEIIGTAGAMSVRLSLPGGTSVDAAGVTAVTVRATHRRRGVLRAMMGRQLDDIADRGEPIAVLKASESVIYGRFGYGLAASAWQWALSTQGTVLGWPPRAGGRLRTLDAEAASGVVPGIYERAIARHPGAISRSRAWWSAWAEGHEQPDAWLRGDRGRFHVVHQPEAGEPDGFVSWWVQRGSDDSGLPAGELHVGDLYATDDEVEAALWEHLVSVDLVQRIHARGRPVEEPLRWRLADPRRLHVRRHADDLWLRVLDPAAALESRRYGTEGCVVLGLHDALRPHNTGSWIVDGGPDGATCRRTGAEPEVELGASELGAVLLGGVDATTLWRAGRLTERVPGALRRLDALLASEAVPWCGTDF